MKEYTYYVRGMHCASCEVLIEKKLLEQKGIKAVEASVSKGRVSIEYMGEKPSAEELNQIFRKENYVFSDKAVAENNHKVKETLIVIGTALLMIVIFLYLNKLGLSGLVNVNSRSSLPTFFVFGLLAGVSTCAALVGGLVLSMSKQWQEIYSDKKSTFEKFQPNLIFNAGRIISYAFFGILLGIIGNKLQISFKFAPFLIIAVSVLMIFLALQMLGVKAFRRFQFTLPKSATRYIADESNFKGRYMPFLMGALTFFLPCGFTITSQAMALLSGNPIQGGLIMLFFALGTAPALLAIGFSSVKFSSQPTSIFAFLKSCRYLGFVFCPF